MKQLGKIDDNSLVLSSASSLSNIIAHKLHVKNITFIDIGTSVNDLLSLDSETREYHGSMSSLENYFYKRSKRYNLKW